MGNVEQLRAGELQLITAGTGIEHSEYNGSKTEPVHFLQIWIVPERAGIAPRYDQKRFSDDEKRGRFRLVGSADGRDGSIIIHQDVALFAAIVNAGEQATHSLRAGRKGWIQVVRGSIEANGGRLDAGDGGAVEDEAALTVKGRVDDSEILLFDLP
jgi:hypothetical protein